MARTVTRKIHFFRLELFKLQQGSSSFANISDHLALFTCINSLPFTGNNLGSRYRYLSNNDVHFMDIDTSSSTPDKIKGRFMLSRRTALPEMEQQGNLTSLNIPINGGLAEITHFIYFPSHNVLGLEFNFFGPRSTSLKEYIEEKSGRCAERVNFARISPILNKDVENTLNNIGDISLIQIELAKNAINITEELDANLKRAFEAAAEVSDAETVELVLRKKKYARNGFPFPFSKQRLVEFITKEDNRENINKFKVIGEDVTMEENKSFDLLEDKLVASKRVVSMGEKSRAVDSTSMFTAIEQAYDELSDNFIIRND
ncbi:hypothetical protein [Brevibacillus agri]|uniref:hypothetical protein n=1 Tax=Brevibacillus agri TaxID=51101 RepID=UPI003D216B1E